MKDKPIVIIITLLGGAVSSICCILKGIGLLWTLLITLITLIVFMIIGLFVNKVYSDIRQELEAQKREQERIAEERRIEREAREAERKEWMKSHPDEPYPGDIEQENAESDNKAAMQEGV